MLSFGKSWTHVNEQRCYAYNRVNGVNDIAICQLRKRKGSSWYELVTALAGNANSAAKASTKVQGKAQCMTKLQQMHKRVIAALMAN